MLTSLFSISFRFFVFLLKRCRDLNFFLRSKQLASSVIYRAIVLIIFLVVMFATNALERVNVDISTRLDRIR